MHPLLIVLRKGHTKFVSPAPWSPPGKLELRKKINFECTGGLRGGHRFALRGGQEFGIWFQVNWRKKSSVVTKSVNFQKIQLVRKTLLQKAATFCYKKLIFEVSIFRVEFLVKIVLLIVNTNILLI